MSMPEDDAQLPLKKRARRRLVGAVALAVLAAVVLPMVMDQAPQTPVADVQIRIPGQEQVPPFRPAVAAKPAEASPAPVAHADKPAPAAPQENRTRSQACDTPPPSEKATKLAEKPAQKAAENRLKKGAENRQPRKIPSVPRPFRRKTDRVRPSLALPPTANMSCSSAPSPIPPTSSS